MFARDRYSHASVWGRKVLLGHLATLPDNKSVEDVHQPLRLSSKGKMNKKLRCNVIQSVIEYSGVLEQRKVPTPSAVTKEVWVSKFKKYSRRSMANRRYHSSNAHKLPRDWSRIMHPNKVWPSLTESISEKAAAAWRWLLTYTRGKAYGTLAPGITMDSAAFSKWMLPCIIVVREGDGAAFASLGNSTWGALVWPLEKLVLTFLHSVMALSHGCMSLIRLIGLS